MGGGLAAPACPLRGYAHDVWQGQEGQEGWHEEGRYEARNDDETEAQGEEVTQFPETVYRVPGLHRGFRTTFDYAPVNSAEELKALKAKGWYLSIWDAIAAVNGEDVSNEPDAVIDRDALEAEAKELGVKFNARTADAVLAERIAAAK